MNRCFIALTLLLLAGQLTAQTPLIPYRVKDKWGYSDTLGKMKIKPRFDFAEFFEGIYASVMVNNAKGLIDRTGKLVIPCLYGRLEIESYWDTVNGSLHYKTVIAHTKNNAVGIYEMPAGKLVVDTIYEDIFLIYGALYSVRTRNNKEGVFDARSGKWIAEPIYNYASPARGNEVIARDGNKEIHIPILPTGPGPKQERLHQIEDVELLEETKIGPQIVSTQPAAPKEHKPSEAELYHMRLYQNNGLYGFRFADKFQGDTIPPVYDSINRYGEHAGMLAVKKNGKWGLINSKNEQLLPYNYDGFDFFNSMIHDQLFVVQQNGQKSLLRLPGKVVAQNYDNITRGEGFFILKRGELNGILFMSNTITLPPQFYRVSKEITTMYLDNKGNKIPLLWVGSGKTYSQSGYITLTGRKYFID